MSGELISPDAGSLTAERQKNEGIIDTLSGDQQNPVSAGDLSDFLLDTPAEVVYISSLCRNE